MDFSFGCFARSGQIDRFRSIYLFWNSIIDNNNDSFNDNSKIHLKCFLCFYCHLLTEWRSFLKYSLKEKNYDHLRVRDDLRYFLSPEREVQPNDSFRVRIILNVTFIPCHEQFRIHSIFHIKQNLIYPWAIFRHYVRLKLPRPAFSASWFESYELENRGELSVCSNPQFLNQTKSK